MSALDLSRWQFAITTVYHFFFVPITLGTVYLVAGFQTVWMRTGDTRYLKLTKFFGKLFLINFAMGVVTGIVQEFQFGMNWADYSRYVGDIFGAPLAMEGLLAFFLESTFLGLWIFGWDRLPKKVHLATIWLTAVGTSLSAWFILSANAWMQHPVGYEISPTTGRPVLNDIGQVLFQNTAVISWFHTMTAAFLVSGVFVAGIAAWHMSKNQHIDIFRPAVKAGAIVAILAGVGTMATGTINSEIMTQQQPMKIAAAEGLYETTSNAPFSLLTVGNLSGDTATAILEIPGMLSWLATGSTSGTVEGVNDLQAQYEQIYGPGNYVPYVPLTYWSYRLMIGLGGLGMLWGLWALVRFRGKREPMRGNRLFGASSALVTLAPLLGISFGWIFTEAGRQPWVVFGLLKTADGGSPAVGAGQVWTSLIAFTLIYGALAVVEVGLLLKYIKAGPPEEVHEEPYDDETPVKTLYFAY